MERDTGSQSHDGARETVHFEQAASHDPAPRWMSALVLALLALAVLKPWSAPGTPAASDSLPAPIAPTAPAATSTAGPQRGATAATPSTGGEALIPDPAFTSLWWVTVIEEDAGHPVRTWYRVEPVTATNELDSAIPAATAYSSGPREIGFCVGERDARRIESIRAWHVLSPRRALEIDLSGIAAPSSEQCDRGALFVPPAGSAPATAAGTWSPGRYVFNVRFTPPASAREWFALDVVSASALDLGPGRGWLVPPLRRYS